MHHGFHVVCLYGGAPRVVAEAWCEVSAAGACSEPAVTGGRSPDLGRDWIWTRLPTHPGTTGRNFCHKFQPQNFSHKISVTKFHLKNLTRKISIEKFQSKNFTWKILFKKFHSKNFTPKISLTSTFVIRHNWSFWSHNFSYNVFCVNFFMGDLFFVTTFVWWSFSFWKKVLG